MNEKMYRLFRLQCQDLMVLADMEYNGMVYDSKGALEEADRLQEQVNELLRKFHILVGETCVNITSGDDLSAVLYGGSINEVFKVAIGHFKSGKQKGQIRYKNEILEHIFPRLVEPIKDTETAKNKKGQKKTWSVGEDILLKLKAKGEAKKIIQLVLEYRGLEKIRSTYLKGWSDLITKNHWEKDVIHGTLNQCVVVTGRLSAEKPNVQNSNKAVKMFLKTRY